MKTVGEELLDRYRELHKEFQDSGVGEGKTLLPSPDNVTAEQIYENLFWFQNLTIDQVEERLRLLAFQRGVKVESDRLRIGAIRIVELLTWLNSVV
jgi:hypothetical protein